LFNCRRRYFIITSFIIAFLISSIALTGILSNNVSQGTERVSATMIHIASASSEGGGDGDQGGDSGGDGYQDNTSEDPGNDQGGDEGGADFQSDSNTEPDGTSDRIDPELTPELSETPEPSPSPSPSPSPTLTPVIITNVNNNQVTVRNDGGFTVQNYQGAVTTTPDCPPQFATVLLGPSTMENGGARILASFEPCVLTDGSVILNLLDEQGI
jgi:hypothetical protein